VAKYFTIDIHTHILPEHIPNWKEKFGYGGFIHLDHHKPCCARMMKDDKFFREIMDNCWSPESRIRECDSQTVDVQVISTVPVMFHYWAKPEHTLETSIFLNDHIADVVRRYPKRFIGLGTLPMQAPDLAIQELKRCKEIGLKGIQIGTNINGLNLSEPQFFQVFKACEELDMALFIHPWDMMGESKMQRYWLPWLVGMPAETSLAICSMIFSGVFERLPKLRVAFAHGGGSFPMTAGRIQHGFDVRPDLCAIDNAVPPKNYIGKFWIDSLVHDPNVLDFVVNLFGPDKIAMGTDYPFPLGELEPGELIRSSKYDDATKEMMLSGAALQWLNMKKEDLL
jgi:aminocarboxymuconate-semialdehyde decarboxylase